MGGGGAPGGQGVLCSHSQLLCLSQQPAGENISFASIPSVLRTTSFFHQMSLEGHLQPICSCANFVGKECKKQQCQILPD